MVTKGARQRVGVNKEKADRRRCHVGLLGVIPS